MVLARLRLRQKQHQVVEQLRQGEVSVNAAEKMLRQAAEEYAQAWAEAYKKQAASLIVEVDRRRRMFQSAANKHPHLRDVAIFE